MKKNNQNPENKMLNEIEKDANQKIKAKSEGDEIMFGLGLFGIVGWSISIPTILGVALGVYLDKKFTSNVSWTITFLFLGIVIGSFNAWRWINEKNE